MKIKHVPIVRRIVNHVKNMMKSKQDFNRFCNPSYLRKRCKSYRLYMECGTRPMKRACPQYQQRK